MATRPGAESPPCLLHLFRQLAIPVPLSTAIPATQPAPYADRRFLGHPAGLGNTFMGWLAGFLETLPGREFWGLHAVLVASAGVLLLMCRFLFGRLLAPVDDVTPQPRG